ncbi:hypothetical protein BDZ89DRAFT_1039910 [Hymenopellis radicata]|nr:hypothetical protein BDZ89DRAFT_1039910 [Hymenopellis radicata]
MQNACYSPAAKSEFQYIAIFWFTRKKATSRMCADIPDPLVDSSNTTFLVLEVVCGGINVKLEEALRVRTTAILNDRGQDSNPRIPATDVSESWEFSTTKGRIAIVIDSDPTGNLRGCKSRTKCGGNIRSLMCGNVRFRHVLREVAMLFKTILQSCRRSVNLMQNACYSPAAKSEFQYIAIFWFTRKKRLHECARTSQTRWLTLQILLSWFWKWFGGINVKLEEALRVRTTAILNDRGQDSNPRIPATDVSESWEFSTTKGRIAIVIDSDPQATSASRYGSITVLVGRSLRKNKKKKKKRKEKEKGEGRREKEGIRCQCFPHLLWCRYMRAAVARMQVANEVRG